MNDTARELDKFYTKTEIAIQCHELFINKIDKNNHYIWLEPSAGNGVFLDCIQNNKIAIDIDPQRNDITQCDFFQWNPNLNNKYVALGNPPFGKNSSLALKFLNRLAEFCNYIGLILPRTFQKIQWHSKINPKIKLIDETILPLNSFEFMGIDYEVPTIFQIWQKCEIPRSNNVVKQLKHPDFEFVDSQQADFAFQRVGARAGLISMEGLQKSPNSHYFIKITNHNRPIYDILQSINWGDIKYQTAGNPSISKHELIQEYEKYLQMGR